MRKMKLKTKLVWHLLLLVIIVGGPGLGAAAAQPSEPKTVVDFFLSAPEKYVDYDIEFRRELVRGERRGSIIDVPNGYIYWNASDNPEEFEFAIFKRRNGKYIVAYSSPYDDAFPNSGRFFLLSYEGGKWRNVTKELLPVKYHKTLTHTLPRHGRTIEVGGILGRRRVHYFLEWENDRFIYSRPQPKRSRATR